jgi:hypothetical protein
MKFIAKLFVTLLCACPLLSHALYDPPPIAALASVEGEWKGALEYKDYQPPYKRVTLPAQLFVTAISPNELALHYVFDDGPKKIVHSYDRLLIDTEAGIVRFSGSKPGSITTAKILSSSTNEGVFEVTAEHVDTSKGPGETTRYRVRLGRGIFDVLKTSPSKNTKDAKDSEGEFRNQYLFKR